MSILTRFLAACAIVAFSVGPVSAATVSNASTTVAQGTAGATTGGISGTAVDETGAPVAGATVTVRGQKTYSGTTDAKGSFSISNIPPGVYLVSVSKAGYDTATSPDVAIFSGETATYSITMHTATLTSLRTIASVRVGARSSFNTSTASVDAVSAADFVNQGQPQVTRVLNQIPGVQISLPQSSANGASPGAITFPNIRGALSFETASLIDGHPVSVGGFGDYVTTFLSPFMFQGVDVIKGPGAMSPQTNYAIGGTINFRTKDPTAAITPDYTFGLDNHGGTFLNLGVSGTLGRWGFVFDVANTDFTGAINNYPATINPSGAVATNPLNGKTGKFTFNDSANFVGGTSSQIFQNFGLVGCCVGVSGTFNGLNELVKLRYKFSDATTATVSYLGSQTLSDQNSNTGSITPGYFCPSNSASLGKAGCASNAAYTGPIKTGSNVPVMNIFPVYNREINNEPILQAEVRTTLGNDTVLGRFYHAGIQRLKREGGDIPSNPTIVNMTLNGVDGTLGAFNNVNVPVKFYDWFNNPEIDSLNGWSFEYTHPMGDNDISFAYDSTTSSTVITSQGASVSAAGAFTGTTSSASVPLGSNQQFSTAMLRGHFQLEPKLSATLSLYQNNYRTNYLQDCYKDAAFTTPTGCAFDYNGSPTAATFNNFTTSTSSHFDQRLGLEWRPKQNLAVRFAAGSAIAPPYIALFSNFYSAPQYRAGNTFLTVNSNTGNLLPETAFGYDLGGDFRFKDGYTVASADLYTTTLYNQIVQGVLGLSPYTCGTLPGGCLGGAPAGIPIYYKSNINLSNARYSGLELALKRIVPSGFGYTLSGSLNRAYPYNLPPCFYSTTPAANCNSYNTLLGIIPNNNFTGGQPSQGFSGNSFQGVSNQNIPYMQAYGAVNYTWKNGAFAEFGDTFYGKNNSLNAPPFGIAYFTARYPLTRSLSIQVSGDNVFNAYSNLFPTVGAGVPIPIAGPVTGLTNPRTGAPVTATQAATTAGALGPANWRFILTKNIGPEPVNQ